MKRRILSIALVLALVMVLVMPTAVFATTVVTGEVVEGYTFTAPTAIDLSTMTPGSDATGNSTGSLTGNRGAGYTVTGIDAKGADTGKMVSGGNVLGAMLKIGDTASPTNTADTITTFLTTSGAGTDSVPFYVSQTVGFADPVAAGYTITISFTVVGN